MKSIIIFVLLFFSLYIPVSGSDREMNLMDDLLIVEYWDRQMNDRLPISYNNLLYGGYWNMPSARMGSDGIMGVGFSYVHPYHNYNLLCQIAPFIEISGNYRVFRGIDDPILTPLGFGDMSDKGANVKFSIFRPEDSDYVLPGLSFGFEDFLGTRNFKARYIVATKVFIKEDLELSLGLGAQRIRGFFGGVNWFPFRRSEISWLKPLSITAEYDATPYKSERIEKHPKGREQRCKINAGVKYRFFNAVDASISYIRGKELACSFGAFYDFGNTEGFISKINDPLPYKEPLLTGSIGECRPENQLAGELMTAFEEQSLDLLEVSLGYDSCFNKTLRLRVYNGTYWLEGELRERLNYLLAGVIPCDIDRVIVVIDSEGFSIQEYHYWMNYVRSFGNQEMSPFELEILSPLKEVSSYDPFDYNTLHKAPCEEWNPVFLPKTHTFFGSSKGKFKYSLGVNVGVEGFLPSEIYYSILLGYNALSNLYDLSYSDRLNPSQLINVRTDIVRYYQQKGVTIDEAYLQKNWNMGYGCYSKVALGYFEEEYAGIALEGLYYPLNSNLAIGLEGAIFRKRSYHGYGFTGKVRKLHGFTPTYKPFPFGSQYFLNLYYHIDFADLDFKIKAGKFLANDYGIRYEVSRYFKSGLEITLWYTHTNGHDHINGSTYYDKGVAFSMPLDVFYQESSQKRWGYGMSAWLRDVGVIAETGQGLYDLIEEHRQK